MILYPAIDMMNGQAVRLRQGRRDDVTVFGSPAEMAKKWRSLGAKWLHLVDLDAAFDGASRALDTIAEAVRVFDGPVELGGGLRSMEDIDLRMSLGVTRCIIGTAAYEHPDLVKRAAEKYPGRIAVGIDAKNGRVALRGWVAETEMTAADLALKMKDAGVTTVIYTDISKDGMMQGPNVAATRELVRATGMDIIGSGGIHSLQDITDMKQAGCAGTILGRSLYENSFTLPEALEAEKNA